MTDKPKNFITTYQSIGGWKAVMYWWNPEMGGFWEPWETGFGAYSTEEKAIEEAQSWAEAEELEYVPRITAYGNNCLRSVKSAAEDGTKRT